MSKFGCYNVLSKDISILEFIISFMISNDDYSVYYSLDSNVVRISFIYY